jgi:hypothetical protein
MKLNFTRLVAVLCMTFAMAVVATSAYSIIGTTTSRMGADGQRRGSIGMSGPFRFDSGSHFGQDHNFRHSFPDRRFHGRDNFRRSPFVFFFGVPRYYQPYYGYTPDYYHGRYYSPPSYYNPGYYDDDQYDTYQADGAYPTALIYISEDIGATWLDSTTLQVAWLGTGASPERLDFSLLDTYKREVMHISSYNPPCRASLVVPNGAVYLSVRAIGSGGLILTDVSAALPDQ